MPAWSSSSLAFSDHNNGRHSSGLLKNTATRISKQHLVEHKMFGSKRGMHGKNIKIGKMFRKKGKGILKSIGTDNVKPQGISPSVDEFDNMMKSISGGSSNNKKRMFSRKSFG